MAITMGDASGVGPEIVLRCAAARDGLGDVVVYGDHSILRRGASLLGLDLDVGELQVVDAGPPHVRRAPSRGARHRVGSAARAYVEAATRDALAGRVAGVVTMP
jgi:4-hydroxythreonine-4-phosphate dehydrogenase